MIRWFVCILLLVSTSFAAVDSTSHKSTFLGTTPLFLCGMLQAELEQKVDDRNGLFVQGRWFAPMEDGLFAGGQLAWRHHFSSLSRGFFVGPYADLNVIRFDATELDEEDYSARILVLGGHWGGRYTFDGSAYIGFRIGAGIPVMKEFERSRPSGDEDGLEEFTQDFEEAVDVEVVRPLLILYSMVDASVSFGYAF